MLTELGQTLLLILWNHVFILSILTFISLGGLDNDDFL